MVLFCQTHLPRGTPSSGGHLQLFQNPSSGEVEGAQGPRWCSVTSAPLLFSHGNEPGRKSYWKGLSCFLSS